MVRVSTDLPCAGAADEAEDLATADHVEIEPVHDQA